MYSSCITNVEGILMQILPSQQTSLPSIITGVPWHITLLNHCSILSPVSPLHYPVNSLCQHKSIFLKRQTCSLPLLGNNTKSKLLTVGTIRYDTACTHLYRPTVHQSLTQPNAQKVHRFSPQTLKKRLPCLCSQNITCLKHLLPLPLDNSYSFQDPSPGVGWLGRLHWPIYAYYV